MKRIGYFLAGMMAMIVVSCVAPEQWEDKKESKTVPQLTNVSVENIQGGAIISYTLPNVAELLYVKVIYAMSDGSKVDRKTSIHNSEIVVEGLDRGDKQTVQLYCGDKSGNESEPYSVEIDPLESPVHEILRSMQFSEALSGIRITWDNPMETNVVLNISVWDKSANRFVEARSVYSSAPAGKFDLRGFEPEETTFAVTIRDKWKNESDVKTETLTPLSVATIEGTLLDRHKFARWNPPGITYGDYGAQYAIEGMWAGNTTGEPFYLGSGTLPRSMTFDMGQTALLTKIIIWQSNNGYYGYFNQKVIEFWGSPSPDVNDSFLGWTYLGTFTSIKPSGLLEGSTPEDNDYARAGETFDIAPENRLQSVRYMRMVLVDRWNPGGNTLFSFNEIQVYGVLDED